MRHNTPKSNQVIWSFIVAVLFLITQLAGQGNITAHAAPGEPELNPAPLFAPGVKPTATLNVPATAFIGEDVNFSVTFDNPGTTAADVGYGPFVDIILDSTGADGDDGLGTTSISASFLGADIQSGDIYITTFDISGNATHPFVLDNTGGKIIVSGTPGDKLVSIRLPFGSFTPDQPAAQIDVKVNMSNLADLGTPLSLSARAGYEFGYTPLNDWCCLDAAYPDAVSSWNGKTVTPTLFTFMKTYSGPESETATGPNFPHQFTITMDIADGQTLTDLDLSDILPANMQFVSLDSVTNAGTAATISAISTPNTTTPGGTLTRRLSSVTGTTGEVDAQMTFTFYIPRDDSSTARVIDPATGSAVLSCNNASVSGSWTPIDSRNVADGGVKTQDPGGCEYSLHDRSIAIQKGVAVVAGTGGGPGLDMLIPTATLEYRLNIQISDFFAFNEIVVTDTFSDGQHFDALFTPTLEVNGNSFALSTKAIATSNFDISCNYSGLPTPVPNADCTIDDPAINDGKTTLIFRLSNELVTRAADVADPSANAHVLLGNLVGGCVPLAGSADPDCGSFDSEGTTATIIFRTTVLHDFVDTYPSGDTSVDQGDILTNTVDISGSALNTLSFANQGSIVSDGSSSSISIGHGMLSKNIYAINGSTDMSAYLDPNGSGQFLVKPGDDVTFQLVYDLVTSDVEDLVFSDYMPLPVFQVGDYTWSFLNSKVIPNPGVVALGPSDDFYSYMVAGSGTTGFITGNTLHPTATIDPVIISDSTSNSITVAFPDYNDTRNLSKTVDLLFTVTVTGDPFADRLYLTNEAHVYEGTTNGSPSDEVDLVQFILTEPVLVSTKAVVASDNPNAVFVPAKTGPVTFYDPGTSGARWSDTIFSGISSSDPALKTGLRAYPINSNLTGADAGDIVTFAIVIENMGSSAKGAFEITILDTLPDEFQVPASGLNLRIANGDNSATFTYHQADGSVSTDPKDLFTTGIRIDDPDPELGACQAHTIGSGMNIIVITYDLQLEADVPPGDITNTSSLTHYAGTPGGDNHLPRPLEDKATVTVVTGIVKTLVSTEIENVVNSKTQVVIGELATYEVVITVPEGSLPAAKLVDNLESGLAFVSLDSFIVSNPDTDEAGLADDGVYSSEMTFDAISGECTNCVAGITDGSSNPLIETDGQKMSFDLGTLTNTNRDNDVAETITITYTVVVVNVTGNQTNTELTNSARLSWTDGSLDSVHAEDIKVIEPYIGTTKSADPILTDAGNIVTYTITLTNPTTTNPDGGPATDAFDITWSDTLPASMTYETGTLAFGTCPATTTSVSAASDPTLSASISDLAPGESCTITFDTKIVYSVEPGNRITNTGTTWWTSLDDSNDSDDVPSPRSTYNTDSIERNGSEIFPVSGINDYGSQGSDDITIDAVVPHKYLISTSELFTGLAGGSQRVAIGEIVRYRLTARLPEGTSTNFQIQDQLPNSVSSGNGHLTFLNDGTAKVSFVSTDSTGNPIVSNTFGSVTGIPAGCGVDGNAADASTPVAPSCVLGDGNIGSSSSTSDNVDNYASGSDVYFKLGTLRNNDNDGDDEFVVIEFNALVDNFGTTAAVSNDRNDRIPNSIIVTINGTVSGGTSSDNVDVYVAEPVLTLSKVVLTPPTDAGDTVVYTLTITATSGNGRATAFDLNLTDTLNANLTPVSQVITSTSSSQGATCIGNGSGTTAYSDSINRVGQNITLTATCLDPGNTIVATVTARVIDTVQTATSIPNTANLTYTSLPGDKGTTSNPTGSSVSGASGSDTGERNGSASPAQNDLRSSSSVSVNIATPSFDKKDANPLAFTIGETVTYDIWVTLPEGITQSLIVIDNIPSGTNAGGAYGMTYISSDVLTSDASLLADFVGTDVTSITGVCANSCSTGDTVGFIFGNVTTTANNNPDDNTFIIRVVLRVDDITGNQDSIPAASPYPTRLINSATMHYTGTGTPKSDSAALITVIEPRITTTKTITSPVGFVQSGDKVFYQIVFTNNGHSMAYDVTADDTLAQGVSYNDDAACTLNSVLAPVTVTGTTTLHFDGNPAGSWDIPVDGNVTCTYSLTAQPGLFLDGVHTNTMDADWFSLDNGNGRSYNDGTTYNFDGTQDTKTASFSAAIPTIAKNDDVVSQVVVGDTITFTLTIGGPTGTIRSAVITDHLPAGLIYNNNAVISGLTAVTPTVSATNDGTTPVTITWTWAGDTAVKSATNATITYSARVADVTSNTITHVLTNNVWLDHHKADGTTATRLTDSHSSTVAEPIINTKKDVSPLANVKAGDVLTYTARFTNSGSSTAYDVTADDTLAQGVQHTGTDITTCEYFNGTSTSFIPVTVTNNTTWLRFDGNPAGSWDIPATDPDSYIECTYTAHAVSGIFADGIHTNIINANWFSMNNGTGRSYDDSVTLPGVDEDQDVDTASFSTDSAVLTKSDDGVTQVVIGETVHITLTIDAPLGTLRAASVVDSMPAGLMYVTGTQSVSAGISAATFDVSAINDGSVPVTLTWDFGDAVVTSSPITITYDAIVANQAGGTLPATANNVDGTNLVNEVVLNYTDVGGNTIEKNASDDFSVIEPVLSLDKTHADFVVVPDAGDSVHYIVTIIPTATSTSTAYDVHFLDVLPADVSLDLTNHSILVTLNDLTTTYSASASSSASNTVDVVINNIPTTATSVVIEYWATLNNSVTPSQLISNTGNVTWTSTPGSNPNERTGTGIGDNDYNDSSTDSLTYMTRLLASPSNIQISIHTIDPSVAIGETITFELHITLPEGTTPSLQIADDLPDGLQYIVEEPLVIPAAGFIGTIPTPTITPSVAPTGSGEDISIEFGAITVLPDGDTSNDSFSIRFRAVVLNETGNQSPNTLTNTATMTIDDQDYESSVDANIIEPVLTIEKTASDPFPGQTRS